MKRVRIRALQLDGVEDVVGLWGAADLKRPWNDLRKTLTRKLEAQLELIVCLGLNLAR